MLTYHKKKGKHLVIKSHRSHNWVIALVILVMFIMGGILYQRVQTVDAISEDNYKVLVVGLLFTLNITFMILVVLMASFYIEVKDHFIEE